MSRSDRAALDEATVRAALTVQFDACDHCRACVSYCDAFPLMFDLIHPRPAEVGGSLVRAAGDLMAYEQDLITDACVRCGRCVEACPYGYDVPALAERALAMRRATGQLSWRRRAAELVARLRRRSAGSAPA